MCVYMCRDMYIPVYAYEFHFLYVFYDLNVTIPLLVLKLFTFYLLYISSLVAFNTNIYTHSSPISSFKNSVYTDINT